MADGPGRAELQEYLAEHSIQPKLNEVLNALCVARPADPLKWLAKQLSLIHI